MEVKINSTTISFVKGDITHESTDAVVNAANAHLTGGSGVDGAIHRAGGPEIMAECMKITEGCPTGTAVITTAGHLKARNVIHTVGPIYKDGRHNEAELLASAYTSSLKLAIENGLKSIAFPSISTGAYGYPLKEASAIAVKAVADFVKANPGISLVRFVLFSDEVLKTYSDAIDGAL